MQYVLKPLLAGSALALSFTMSACVVDEAANRTASEDVVVVDIALAPPPTKMMNGMSVADKGNDPGFYFDGGAAIGEIAEKNLKTFDELDYEVFSSQDWANLHKSHAHNVVVTWPDGHETYGIDKHIEDLKWLFVHAPDTRIKQHPVRIGAGPWTAVQGIMEGTFTRPMQMPDGSTIEPTGKSFSVPMATIAYWHEGRMVQEWLFWDNQTYFGQMGIGG